jgi:molybdopterin-guanine dinucleotide biosynthesis protein A
MNQPLVAVLAGGQGRRLGGGKAAATLDGRPLIDYPLAAARGADLEAVVVAKRSSVLPPLEVPLILEPERPQHPLRGLVTALERFPDRRLVVLACDMPLVPPRLLAALGVQPGSALVCEADGRVQPFLGVYTSGVLPQLRTALAEEAPLRDALHAVQPRVLGDAWLQPFGDPVRCCFSVNTPAELEQAAEWLAEAGAAR